MTGEIPKARSCNAYNVSSLTRMAQGHLTHSLSLTRMAQGTRPPAVATANSSSGKRYRFTARSGPCLTSATCQRRCCQSHVTAPRLGSAHQSNWPYYCRFGMHIGRSGSAGSLGSAVSSFFRALQMISRDTGAWSYWAAPARRPPCILAAELDGKP